VSQNRILQRPDVDVLSHRRYHEHARTHERTNEGTNEWANGIRNGDQDDEDDAVRRTRAPPPRAFPRCARLRVRDVQHYVYALLSVACTCTCTRMLADACTRTRRRACRRPRCAPEYNEMTLREDAFLAFVATGHGEQRDYTRTRGCARGNKREKKKTRKKRTSSQRRAARAACVRLRASCSHRRVARSIDRLTAALAWHGAVRRGAARRGAVRCGAVRCGAVRCGAVRCGAARRGATRAKIKRQECAGGDWRVGMLRGSFIVGLAGCARTTNLVFRESSQPPAGAPP